MTALARTRSRPVSRISISLPEDLLCDLDQMVQSRGFETRSQAVNDIDRKSTRLNSSHLKLSRMPSSA